MRIVDVSSHALSAPNPESGGYWGRASWGVPSSAGKSNRLHTWEPHRFPAHERMRPSYADTVDTVVVRVETDTGLIGWGEAKAPVAPHVCKTIIDELLAGPLVGRDPFDVEAIWETAYASMRLRGHDGGFLIEAISGVDIALWDLIGKATGQPLHKLMGGAYRQRVKVYASGVPGTASTPGEPDWERMVAAARGLVDRGFSDLKMGLGISVEADLRSVAAVREALDPRTRVFVDAGGNYDVSGAIALGRALETMDVGFLEAPLPPEHVDGYARVAAALAMPVANDVITTRYQVLDYLTRGGLDIVQPDVCRSGGLTELKRIAVLADAFGVGFTPHVSIGSAIHFAASLQIAAAVPNLVQMEYWAGTNPLGDAILREPALEVEEGYVAVPQGPGLGLDIDEDELLAHAQSA